MNDLREPLSHVRLDVWLWAARFFKTRALAAEAVDGGRVDVNGGSAKRSKAIRVGDEIAFRSGPFHYKLEVLGLAERRGPAADAVQLYREDQATKSDREAARERLRMQGPISREGDGRPTKQQRRAIQKWKGRL